MTGFFILLIILIIDIALTIFYANRLENIIRMLKNNTTEQIILSESRIKERINRVEVKTESEG